MELVLPGLGLIFWMTLAFLLLLFILKKFAWKPILKALKEREDSIDNALHAADIARGEMQSLQLDNEKLLAKAKEDRDEILASARKVKENIIEEAKERAGIEADRIVASARENIHYEKMQAITELKNQLATLSIEIAEKVLRKEFEADGKQREVIEMLVKEAKFN